MQNKGRFTLSLLINQFAENYSIECCTEKDINEVFDDLLFAEERLIEEGYKEGFNQSLSQDNTEAYHLGYHRGAEIGAEIGYYKGIVDIYLGRYKSADAARSSAHAKKIVENLETLNESLGNFPRSNSENVDILGRFNHIRAHFRKICALLKCNHLLWDETDSLSF